MLRSSSNRLGATLVVVAGLMAAVGLVMVVYAHPAEATFPATTGKIAYTRSDGHDHEIYAINPDGGNRRRLTNNASGDYYPSYSPDGNRIVYASSDGNDFEIYTIEADGGGKQQVTDNTTRDRDPSWGSR